MDIDRANFLSYIQKEYPDLYQVEKEKERLAMTSGFGDISIVLRMVNGVIDTAEIMGAAKIILRKRHDNIFEK